jgi:hypothetical protein
MRSGQEVRGSQAEIRGADGTASGDASLTLEQILAWADAYHSRHGRWPEGGVTSGSGPVDGVPGERWQAINVALAMGLRGLPGNSSLAELLAEHRGAPAPDMGPRALAEKIWTWEQEHFAIKQRRTRSRSAGPAQRPALSIARILEWADMHRAATGRWPTNRSGSVQGADGESWRSIDNSLRSGHRGLAGGLSLGRVLAEHRGKRNVHSIKPLTVEQILAWADAHHAACGRWPNMDAGPVEAAPGETWSGVNIALIKGARSLVGGTCLARLLIEHRGPEAHNRPPALTVSQILAWADQHHTVTGRWPSMYSGEIVGAGGETWNSIGMALGKGLRGLPGGTSLACLLEHHRGHRHHLNTPRLTHKQILAWVDAHHAATGRWPNACSGPIAGAPGETWRGVSLALQKGGRGLHRGTTLARLLQEHRGRRPKQRLPILTLEEILAWAEAHEAATGRWPSSHSGRVRNAPHETWVGITSALRMGRRGLSGGLSLAALRNRNVRPDSAQEGSPSGWRGTTG